MAARLLAVHQGGGVGGAPVSLLKLLAGLDRAQFQPEAVFTERGDIVQFAAELGVRARVVPTGGAFFYSAHARLGIRSIARFLRTFPGSVTRARHALRRQRPDLIHLNTSVLLAWAAAARRERVPVVWVVREVLGPNPALRAWHAGFIGRQAREVVAISDAVAACFPFKVERIYNAVDLADFRLDLSARSLSVRGEFGIRPEAQLIAMVGAVQRPQGHWLLLDALAHLPEVEAMLITGGVDPSYETSLKGRVKRAVGVPLDNLDAFLRDAHERGASNRLHVTGYTRDVARLLAAADLLVFPSLEPEGFGRPIIEAMALARPVVATDVGPSRELLGDDAGALVPPDARALGCTIADLLKQPELRERMGKAGRARVEQYFGLERQVAEMSGVYRRALAG